MPNWCSNRMIVAGPAEELDRFWTQLEPNVVSGSENPWNDTLNLLNTFVPMPEKYEGTVEGSDRKAADDGQTWYDWANKNWGCKWPDSEGVLVERTDEHIVLEFTTPWGPPVDGIQRVADLFPTLTFICGWHEDGMQMDGQFWFPIDADPDDIDPDDLTLPARNKDEDEDYEYSSFPEINGHTGHGSG